MADLSPQAPAPQSGVEDQLSRRTLPVSLVIPVRDEQRTLHMLFSSIDDLTEAPAEIIFVDGGSTDRTVAMLEAKAQSDARYRVRLADGQATPGRGRNLGVAAAKHDWVAMTDAGIRISPGWLSALWEAHIASPQAAVVYGNVEFDLRSVFEECAVFAYGTPKQATPAGLCRGPSTQSFMVHRSAFESVGGFPDLRAGEDDIFIRAVEAAGIVAAWAPEATVWWQIRPDLASTAERFRLYSYSYAMAGRERFWHMSLARNYVPVLLGVLLGASRSPRWFLLAAATVAGRVHVRVGRHRQDPRLRRPGPLRSVLIAGLLLLTDAATALGWLQARRDRFRQGAADPAAGG